MDGTNDRYSPSNTASSRRMKIESARRMITEGHPEAAASILRKVTDTRSDDLQAKCLLAVALFRSGHPSAALPECDFILSHQPHNSHAHHIRGLCLAALGERPRAIEAFFTSTHHDPMAWRSWNSIADITSREDERLDCLQHAASALMAKCNHPQVNSGLLRHCTKALICAGRSADAVRFTVGRFEKFSSRGSASESLARALYADGAYEDAAFFAREALAESPVRHAKPSAYRYFFQPAKAARAVQDIMTLLDDAGLTSFLTGGTLLGFVRNGAPLPHDRDADIGILCDRNARPDITVFLRDHPSIQLGRSARAGDRYIGLTFESVAVDLFLYEAEGPYRLCGLSDYPGEIQWRFSGFGISRKIWQGASWNIPDNPDKLLSETYGQGWRMPDKDFSSVLSSPALYMTNPHTRTFYAAMRSLRLLRQGRRSQAISMMEQAPHSLCVRNPPRPDHVLSNRLSALRRTYGSDIMIAIPD
nr:tetratricopeptide repeat protein [uncultured Hyphomonas sp.]